jgi:hypothetical protein
LKAAKRHLQKNEAFDDVSPDVASRRTLSLLADTVEAVAAGEAVQLAALAAGCRKR